MPEAAAFLQEDSVIGGRYRVTDLLGVGGTAVVYECDDLKAHRKVAVKRFFADKMTPTLTSRIEYEPELRERIGRRYVILAMCSFFSDGHWHSVLPLIRGELLSDLLQARGPARPATALYHGIRLAKAASALCAVGVVGTDFKPDNIIVTPTGESVVIDLTCYEWIGKSAYISLGTRPYAPPELAQHVPLTAATDVFSVGVVICEMLLGCPEFEKVSASWDTDLCRGMKPDLSRITQMCPAVAPILKKSVEPRPHHRYDSPDTMLQDLLPCYETLTGVSSRFVLLCREDGRQLRFGRGRWPVGREQINPSNNRISEDHLELDVTRKALKVRDNGSLNGTAVNGKRIGPAWVELQCGDLVAAADVKLIVKVA